MKFSEHLIQNNNNKQKLTIIAMYFPSKAPIQFGKFHIPNSWAMFYHPFCTGVNNSSL